MAEGEERNRTKRNKAKDTSKSPSRFNGLFGMIRGRYNPPDNKKNNYNHKDDEKEDYKDSRVTEFPTLDELNKVILNEEKKHEKTPEKVDEKHIEKPSVGQKKSDSKEEKTHKLEERKGKIEERVLSPVESHKEEKKIAIKEKEPVKPIKLHIDSHFKEPVLKDEKIAEPLSEKSPDKKPSHDVKPVKTARPLLKPKIQEEVDEVEEPVEVVLRTAADPSLKANALTIGAAGITLRDINDEMKQSYLDYAMSVIVGRALPDVRDGLKPVHRRILYAMNELGMFYNRPYKKCARIVGEVLGKYHPHGDTAVYDSLVRMAQDFSMRYPLIQGQGNFGSIDGDSAAAMRYTEARLAKISNELLQDLDKETIEFLPNFDNTLHEPSVLPSKIPNLLINGSSGIAVGMATVIPPHNIKETCEAVIRTIDNPDISADDLIDIIPGPDFPTAGIICGRSGIRQYFSSGRGRLKVRGRAEVEENHNKKAIIITEVPYMVNKSQLVEQIAQLIRDKVIQGVSDIRDESDRDGLRVVIELKKDANTDIALNLLYKHSRLQVTFGVIMVALVNNQPKTLPIKDLITHFIDHRRVVVRRRTEYDLMKAKERSHILAGLIIALDDIDNIIAKIKASRDGDEARSMLMNDYSLSEEQSKAILDMRLQRLASLEQVKIRDEQKQLLMTIEELNRILSSEVRILDIIKTELSDVIKTYGDKRKTEIIDMDDEESDIDVEELIEEQDQIITISHSGYIKRQSMDQYKQQRRGGKGIKAAGTKEEDFIQDLFVANTHSYILFFTGKGDVHWKKVYQIPEAGRQAKGVAIVNLLNLDENEKVTAFIPVKDFKEGNFLVMATERGTIKKTGLENFSRPRQGGIRAITLDDNEVLIEVKLTDGTKNIIIATRNGQAVKFNEKNLRTMGRTAHGVRGIKLKKDDIVVGMEIADEDKTLLTITENGFGKRTEIGEYRLISRGGSGVKNIICSARNGKVVSIKAVSDGEDIMFISRSGIAIRTPVKDLSVIGRATQGVRLMKLNTDDKVVGAARIINSESEEEAGIDTNGNGASS